MQIRNNDYTKTSRRVAAALFLLSASHAMAGEKTLFSFIAYPVNASEQTGASPRGTLLQDTSGALYGAASNGGPYWNGTIFKLTPPDKGQTAWKETVLYAFTGGFDGSSPNADLVMDSTGAIYGTASGGGYWTNDGVAFKLTPPAAGETQWKYDVIHYFYFAYADGGDSDGANPSSGLIMDSSGALYGLTHFGGSTAFYTGYGTVFKLTPLNAARTIWDETVLYRFRGDNDGHDPFSTLTRDAAGALYGSTIYGGTGQCADWMGTVYGCGTVFKLTPPAPGQIDWTKTTLHHFNGADGSVPAAKLLLGAGGELYGTTFQGGSGQCTDSLEQVIGCGTIFELTPPPSGQSNWTASILHDFVGPEGANPEGGLVPDGTGALIGTTYSGGSSSYGVLGYYGVVYKLIPPPAGLTQWTQTVLYNFDISTSGERPEGEVVRDPQGNLYGVTYMGGSGSGGTVYQITPVGHQNSI